MLIPLNEPREITSQQNQTNSVARHEIKQLCTKQRTTQRRTQTTKSRKNTKENT